MNGILAYESCAQNGLGRWWILRVGLWNFVKIYKYCQHDGCEVTKLHKVQQIYPFGAPSSELIKRGCRTEFENPSTREWVASNSLTKLCVNAMILAMVEVTHATTEVHGHGGYVVYDWLAKASRKGDWRMLQRMWWPSCYTTTTTTTTDIRREGLSPHQSLMGNWCMDTRRAVGVSNMGWDPMEHVRQQEEDEG